MAKHIESCGRYCPYPDTSFIAPGASLPKCRGGDCTLCDESECSCPCQRHIYADGEQFPQNECPACAEEAEAEYEIAMEFAMDEERL